MNSQKRTWYLRKQKEEQQMIELRNHHLGLLGITTKHEIKIGTQESPVGLAWDHHQALEEYFQPKFH